MPPYATQGDGVVPSPTWLANPDPDIYESWDEFAKQLWWDYQMGEAFVICTARYADGYPARFHVLEPWLVDVEMGSDGRRQYRIGIDRSRARPAPHPLQVDAPRPPTASARSTPAGPAWSPPGLLQRYASRVIESGGVPYYVIKHPEELTGKQVTDLQTQWWESRMNSLGMPAILSGGIEIEQLQISPEDMALLDLSQYTDSRIAVLLGVPPFLVGLPSGGDSMTYSNVTSLFDYHWRARAASEGLAGRPRPVAVGAPTGHRHRGQPRRVRAARPVHPGPDLGHPHPHRRAVTRGRAPPGAVRHQRPVVAARHPSRPQERSA